MKTRHLFPFSTLAVVLSMPAAHAANDRYWDSDGSTAGGSANTVAAGTWGTSNFWTTASGGNGAAGTFTATTNNTNDLHFSASTDVTGAYNVTVNAGQSANSIIFEEGTVTLNAGSLTLGGGGGVNSGLIFNNTTGANVINTALVLGAAITFTNNDNNLQTINGGITGSFGLTLGGSGTGGFSIAIGTLNNTGTVTNSITGTGTAAISAAIGPNVTDVIQNGAASILTLSGANSHTGVTTINAGALSIASTASLPGWNTNGKYSVAGGATLVVQNAVSEADTATMLGTTNFSSGANIGFDTSAGNRNHTLPLTDTAQGQLGLAKSGANSLVISGTNTYTGSTVVNAGTLLFSTPAALYNANPTNWTAANLTVASSATLALNLGGTGDFSTTQAATIAANLTAVANNGFKAGSNLGFDTTNAPGDVTFSQALVDSAGTGGGAVGFTKLGTGTLILNQANTHTGTTTVSNGTLVLSGNRTANAGPLTVGNTASQTGTLDISNGAFLANNFTIGSGDATVSGVVNHSAGSITLIGNNQMLVANGGIVGGGAGTGSFGTYNLSGGTLTGSPSTTRGVILGVNSGCTGTINVSGTGNLALASSNMQVGRSDSSNLLGSAGVFTQSGGTAAIGTLTIAGGGTSHTGTTGTVTLTGGSLTVANFSQMGSGVSCTAQMTIGGTAQVTLAAFPTARGSGSTARLTMDGGTLIPAAPSTTFMAGLTNAYLTGNGAKFNVPNGRDITIGQSFEDATAQAGALTKSGAGVLTLTGSNTHTGATSVTGGTLSIAETGTLAGTSGLSVGSGARFNYLPSGVGTLTLGTTGTLNLANNSTLGLTFDSTIAAPAAATASGIINLVVSGSYSPGTPYTLLTAASGLTAGGATYRFLNPIDFTFTTIVSDTSVQITPAAATALSSAYWVGGLSGSSKVWAASNGSTTSNWASDGTGTPTPLVPGATANLVFNDASPSPGNLLNMTLGTDMAIGGLTANSANNLSLLNDGVYTLTIGSSGITVNSGTGSVTLNPDIILGSAQNWINDSANPLTLGGAVSSNGFNPLTIDGTGATTIANFIGGSGGLIVAGGTTTLTSATPTVAQTWTNNSATPLTIGTLVTGNALLTIDGSGTTNISNFTGANGGITVASGTTNITSAALASSQTWTGNSTSNGLSIGTVNNNGYGLTLGGTGNSEVTGIISGTGALAKTGTGTLTLNGANTYSGATVVNGGVLVMGNANALGTTSSGTAQSGTSEIRLTGGLTIAEPVSINGGGITNLGTIRNFSGDNTWSATITQAAQSRINSDEGTLTLSAPVAVSSPNFAFLVLGGNGNINIPGILALGTGGVAKDGTGTLTLSGANTYGGPTKVDSGTLNMAGSTTATGLVTVGNSATNTTATINVLNGATLTGGTVSAGTVTGASGAVNITGGSLLLSTPETTDEIAFGAVNGSYGALKMSAGTFTQSRLMFGGVGSSTTTGGIGVGHISGGTVNTNGWFILSRSGASTGVLTVTGGVINHANAAQVISIGLSGSGRAELNVAGGLIDNTGRNVTFSGGTTGSFHWMGTGVVNLNAGTLVTNRFAYDAGSPEADSYINFAGGTLKASASSTQFIPAFTPAGTGINKVLVHGAFGGFAGGSVIDTNGFDSTIGASLLAPTGNGITSLTIVDGGSGYIGAPAVQILDDGQPSSATAYAVVGTDSTDALTFGKVTAVVITNPGVIVGTPSVSLIGGGGSGADIAVAATGPNTSGGLTKTGAGRLNLDGANTYTGTTTVTGGSLGGIGSIAGPLVVSAGASVAPGASAGTLTTGAATISGTYLCEIDGANTDKLAVNGALNISAATLDIDLLAGGATEPVYVIATYTGSTPAPFLSVVDPIPGYSLVYNYNDGVSSNNIALVQSGTPYTIWAQGYGLNPLTDGAPEFDKDGDGQNNALEFALGGSPVSGANNAKIFHLVADGDADPDATKELLMTIAVRNGTPVFSGSPSPAATHDGFTCTIQGGSSLIGFPAVVTSVGVVLPPVPNDVPPAGYQYRTFSLDGSNGLPNRGFLRVKVSP